MFAALPKELQEELRSAYNRGSNAQPPAKICTSGDKSDSSHRVTLTAFVHDIQTSKSKHRGLSKFNQMFPHSLIHSFYYMTSDALQIQSENVI